MVTELELARLAFIRELYQRAVATSMEPEPIAAMSVLGFHDAVELFLHLMATHVDAKVTRNMDFGGYFDRIDAELLEGSRLEGRGAMLQLNQARVGLKHQGILPAHQSIEGHRAATTSFLEANTPIVFEGLGLANLDMAQVVTFSATRSHLAACRDARDANDIVGALTEAAIAFEVLLAEFRDRTNLRGFKGWASVSSPSIGSGEIDDALGDLAGEVEVELTRLEGMIEYLSLGIDMVRWQRFAQWTPRVHKTDDGWAPMRSWAGTVERLRLDAKHVDYCRDLVVDSALRLQGMSGGEPWL